MCAEGTRCGPSLAVGRSQAEQEGCKLPTSHMLGFARPKKGAAKSFNPKFVCFLENDYKKNMQSKFSVFSLLWEYEDEFCGIPLVVNIFISNI